MKKFCKFSLAVLFSFVILCFGGVFKSAHTNANAAGIVTITFNPSGGECSTTELQTTDEGKLDTLPEPTKDGCFFNGWYTEVQKINKVTTDTVFNTDTMLYAGWAERTFSYVVTEDFGTYSIIGHTTVPEINYPLASNISTIDEIFETITNELPDTTTPVTLNLRDFAFTSTLSIPFTSFTLSGNLAFDITDTAITVAPSSHSSTIIFKDLTITGTCKNYITFETTEKSANITFNNCDFLATTSEDYGINISSAFYSMTFDVFFNHSSTYLFDYVSGLKVFMETELADGSKIIETTHHTQWRTEIIKKFNRANLDNFSLLPKNDFYDLEIITSDASLRASSYLKTTFDLAGGSFVQGYTEPRMYYMPERTIILPTAENINFPHFNFLGWIAVLEFSDDEKTSYGLNENTYYFNKNRLQSLKNNNFDYSSLNTLDYANIPETNADEYFTTYNYYNNEDVSSLILKMYADLKKEPVFLALYEDIFYSISFVTNTDTTADDFVGIFNDTITFPTLTKTGYDFAGWFEDEELTTPFTATNLSDTNLTIYAKWTPKTYKLTIHHNNETTDSSVIDIVFGDTITYPTVSYKGHVFAGYYEDSSFITKFTSETMPSRNVELYIKWDIKQIKIYVDSRCSAILNTIVVNYDETIPVPPAPNNPGYEFLGWYTSLSYTTPFDFSVMPENDTKIYARWVKNLYTITFNSNGGSIVSTMSKYYGETISSPAAPVKKGYNFIGWFSDAELTQIYNFTTMPNNNLTLYAKWTKKEIIQLSDTPQSFRIDEIARDFTIDNNLSGFVVRYFVDGEWTNLRPQNIGTYDVSIFRPEDNNYAEFSLIIKNGYILNNKVLNILWIAIILYIVFVIEIGVVIFLRILINKKRNDFIALSVTLPFGVVSTSQFVMVIVGVVLVLFGFILMVYQLVKLHRTLPNEYSTPSEFDNTINVRKIVDKSEDKQIDTKVDDLLKSEFSDFDSNNINNSQNNENDLINEDTFELDDDEIFNKKDD